MTQYNTLNVKLSNLQLDKLKSGIKKCTEESLKILSNIFGDSNDENDFRQVLKLRKTFANSSSANIKSSKNQLHKIWQSGRFLDRFLGPLLKTWLPLIGNVLKLLAKNVLIPLELTAAASATDTATDKKTFVSGTTTLIISNKEINIMKIIKSLEESGLLIKGISETIKNEAEKQKVGFLSMLLGALGVY